MLEIKNVTYAYDSEIVLDDISFEVNKNDFLSIIGVDDAGKTTLLHLIMRFQKLQEGHISLTNNDTKICFIPDDIIWEKKMNARQYLEFLNKNNTTYDVQLQNKLCKIYKIDVEEVLLDMTYQDNKLVQLIGAVCSKPQLLILDEPFNFLTKATYYNFMKFLKKLNSKGMGIIIVAEKFDHVKGFCNKYVYIKSGKIISCEGVSASDIYPKVVIVTSDKKNKFKDKMDKEIFERNGKSGYLYTGDMKSLSKIIMQSDCKDWSVEELTLEEIVNQDFSRWE